MKFVTRMLLYYITDRRQIRVPAAQQRDALLNKISEAASCGVDFIQLREKDLSARELLRLAQEAGERIAEATRPVAAARKPQPETRLLINSRLDVALASGAGGVHLRGDDISAAEARAVWMKATNASGSQLATRDCVIAVSCHSEAEVRRAESDGAGFAVFAPVFEKGARQGAGLEALRDACRGVAKANTPEASPAVRIPVFALGGVTPANAGACVEAGAAGIAGIRLFQENDVAEVVARLRNMEAAAK